MRELQRLERGLLAGADRRLDLSGGDLQSNPADFDALEAQRQFGERHVAAATHVVDDVGDGQIDVGRRLALGGDERGKALIEIRRLHIERHGHG